MAVMYPQDIEGYEKATEGEKKVFRFLKEAARPDKDFICWYEPQIGVSGQEPDFILLSKKHGLLVIEVKDWASNQIISYDPHHFTIRIAGKTEKRTNPKKQAKSYVHALMDRLKGIPGLVLDSGSHEGALKIPIESMVFFVNISREEYHDKALQWLIPFEIAMLGDDLEPAGEILCDESGCKFLDRIAPSFPFPFRGLKQREIEKLSFAIWPERIELPVRDGAGKSRFQAEVQGLDEAQARLALRLKRGHQIIKGPPGSGKTLVLVHRCCHLHRYDPQVKRILLLCFNIALVSYLKRLIQEKGLGIGDKEIQVFHFYELCSEIMEEAVHYENEDEDYYDLVIQESLEKIAEGEGRVEPFDAVLIDEGQDFDGEMLKVAVSLLRPHGDLIICLDPYQDLYRRRGSWKSLGIKASGRTTYLQCAYRNTREILEFTQRFIGQGPQLQMQGTVIPFDFALHGELPILLSFQDAKEVEDFLIRNLNENIEQEEYKKSEIAVLYDDKVYSSSRFAYDNRTLPIRLLKRLQLSGIPTTWVSQDVRAKEMFDPTTDRVSLISIHSAKGLDFDLVYLIGIDHIQPTEATMENLISLVYVAMTRAKYRLVIPYVEETELIKRMKACLPTHEI